MNEEESIVDKCIESKWKYITTDDWVVIFIKLAKSLEQENKELRKEIEDDNAELDTAWSKVVELNDRVKMLEDIIAKHTSIPKAVIPMLTTKFPEIVQSEITQFDPNSTEVKELIEKCKPYLDYNTNNEILTLHQNNIE